MITAEPSPSVQTTLEEGFFDPLYKVQIPDKELNELISKQASLKPEELLSEFDTITQRITLWLETAHMIAFTIEQNVKRGDTIVELYTVEPLELSCNKVQPLIQLLAEFVDEQDELNSNYQTKLKWTKIQSEWSGLQHFISFVKNLIEESNEKFHLRTLMENILLQIDDLSIMIFQFQEKRHIAAVTISPATPPPEANTAVEEQSKKEDSILLEIDNRVGPLFTSVEKVYTRMTSPNPPQDNTGLLTRKHLLVQERWECLRVEIDELKMELKEDRWLVVFKQVADQVDEMMNGLDKTVAQCYSTIQQIKEHGVNYLITSSSSTTSNSSSSTTNTINSSSNTTPGMVDLKTKLRSVEKNFEAKYKYYTPSIAKMLMMLGNGIAARVSRNVATLQRHEAMLARWDNLKATMDHLRKRDLPDIVVVESTMSDNTSNAGCWSRLSDRSDSTAGSISNWKDLLPPSSTPTTARFIHNKSSSPSLSSHMDETNSMDFVRSRSPYNTKFNNHSPSPSLFIEEKSRRTTPGDHHLWRSMNGGSASPNNGGRRTASPSFYTRDSFSPISSGLRPSSISPSSSRTTQTTQVATPTMIRLHNRSPDIVEEEEDDDMISTKDFRRPTIRSKSSLSANQPNQHLGTRSVTPSIRRSGTPSMIPRPKTPNTNKNLKLDSSRPRSSMARITNLTSPKLNRSQSPFTSATTTTTKSNSKYYKPDPKDPLDKEVAMIVNRSPIPIQCSKKQGGGDGRYYFGNELTPSLGGGKKIYTCKLMTYENSGRNKVLIRVGGGWQDLEIFLLEHMNLIG
ncbi:uncharacterized protein B0P05DRAFT_545284 [Gilbertella persicaria]|uniref:uncharacterized protein n=1 Tax=Gilbertella persicaria TaxID=101096 RepID=UPI002220E418|nr:uncharacterized protein B0P05DRAFT_545284 [Gilbertella persicaria]KAI8076640.1 hypothetical protein B0P05DRAFT_545284 [Gilbertella persicaria]